MGAGVARRYLVDYGSMDTSPILSWYIAGPLTGLVVPMLLLIGNKSFGISSSLRHTCALFSGGRLPRPAYDWKREGLWNMIFVVGLVLGGWLAVRFLGAGGPVDVAPRAQAAFAGWGVGPSTGLLPAEIFSWGKLTTLAGFLTVVVGGFLVGFGARWAGGCTSGHAITGTSNLDRASLLAVVCFFVGGLIAHWLLVPGILAL